jgi:LPXTG-site transpeptidase (sortase) family protein
MTRPLRLLPLVLLTALLCACGGTGGAPVPAEQPPAATAEDTTAAVVRIGRPTRVEIPSIQVDSALVPVGLEPSGAMQTPNFGMAAWYEPGPRPGENGPAVVVAHVDSKAGPDVFYRLRELKPGDRVTVHREDGASTFAVESREQIAKDKLPVDRIWNQTSEPVLRLITCGGAFNRAAGSYLDNIIVYARLVA